MKIRQFHLIAVAAIQSVTAPHVWKPCGAVMDRRLRRSSGAEL